MFGSVFTQLVYRHLIEPTILREDDGWVVVEYEQFVMVNPHLPPSTTCSQSFHDAFQHQAEAAPCQILQTINNCLFW